MKNEQVVKFLKKEITREQDYVDGLNEFISDPPDKAGKNGAMARKSITLDYIQCLKSVVERLERSGH